MVFHIFLPFLGLTRSKTNANYSIFSLEASVYGVKFLDRLLAP
jgi:hypothetical protein